MTNLLTWLGNCLSNLPAGGSGYKWGRQAGAIGAAVVGAVGVVSSVISSNKQSKATEQAGSDELAAQQAADATQMAMFQQEQTDMKPYIAMGTAAGGALMNLMGISSTSPQTLLNAPNSINQSTPSTGASSSSADTAHTSLSQRLSTGSAGASFVNAMKGAPGRGYASGTTNPANTPRAASATVGQAPKEVRLALGGFMALGGEASAGTYVVGEQGPEIIHLAPGSHGFVQPNPKTAATNPEARKNFMAAVRNFPHRLTGGMIASGGIKGMLMSDQSDNQPASHAFTGSNMDSFSPAAQAGLKAFQAAQSSGNPNPAMAQDQAVAKYYEDNPDSLSKLNAGAVASGTSGTNSRLNAPIMGGLNAGTPSSPASNAPSGASGAVGLGTTNSQTQADQTLGQGLGAGYNAQTADTASGQVLQSSPQYQFAMQQGIEGLDASAAASGGLLSGGHLAAILNYSQGLASQQYNNVYNQLMGVTSMGEAGAAGAASNALYTGMGVSNNQMQLGEEQAQNAYAQGNASVNEMNGIEQGLGSAYQTYMFSHKPGG